MINLDENKKSETMLTLERKLEKDKLRLQEQAKREHRKREELKKRSKAMIGDLFEGHLPDYYNFEAAELKAIIDTAMSQRATMARIAAIRNGSGDALADEDPDGDDVISEEEHR